MKARPRAAWRRRNTLAVAGFAWSRDGQRLAIAQAPGFTSDIVLFRGVKGKPSSSAAL